jgi:hypothetical protein
MGFKVDDDLRQQWETLFAGLPHPTVDSVASANAAATSLSRDIDWTSEQLFNCRKALDPRGVRWWSEQCKLAIHVYKAARPSEKAAMYATLRNTITKAKRDYANDYLDHCSGDSL